MKSKVTVRLNEDGLFCIDLRGETERMAVDTEHLKEELETLGVESFYSEELKRDYDLHAL